MKVLFLLTLCVSLVVCQHCDGYWLGEECVEMCLYPGQPLHNPDPEDWTDICYCDPMEGEIFDGSILSQGGREIVVCTCPDQADDVPDTSCI